MSSMLEGALDDSLDGDLERVACELSPTNSDGSPPPATGKQTECIQTRIECTRAYIERIKTQTVLRVLRAYTECVVWWHAGRSRNVQLSLSEEHSGDELTWDQALLEWAQKIQANNCAMQL